MDLKSQNIDAACVFLAQLQVPSLSLDDVCRILTLSTFAYANLDAVLIFDVNDDATLSMNASFGVDPNIKKDNQSISLTTQLPVAHAVRYNKMVWFDGKDGDKSNSHLFTPEAKKSQQFVHVAVPILKLGAPIGCIGFVGKSLNVSIEGRKFLELISLIISIRFFSGVNNMDLTQSGLKPFLLGQDLTDRERLIQDLMAHGRTNGEIADELGFSDSTIRQDAIRLFAKLGVSNREDAGKLFKKK